MPSNPPCLTSRVCSTTSRERPQPGSERILEWLADWLITPAVFPSERPCSRRRKTLTERFHTIQNDLTQAQTEVGNNLKASLNDLNSLTGQVADLNQRIVSSESNGSAANDLRDQRNELLKKISGLIGGNSFENKDGSVTFVTTNGVLLVDHAQSWKCPKAVRLFIGNGVPTKH